ncbi:MAG: hypothetical protein QN163_08975 [Armatimonadota bacterium]|nr:hypothetical protein [Armatimonadota bacterium]MDR5697711.1 hypothetical protein [Armatimonadota bacterium]
MAEDRNKAADDPQKAAERRRIIEEAKARWAAKKAAQEGTPAAGAPAAQETREERAAAARAKAEALRAQREGAQAPPAPSIPPIVAAHNPGGTPVNAPANPKLQALGTINQAVEVRADPAEDANLRKLLGGIGAYQNPLRDNAWQVDYRYWKEARRRLLAAGYQIEETDYMGRPLEEWEPITRGWARAELS